VTEVIRIVEQQANLPSYRATQDEGRAAQLELMVELTKPKNLYLGWHYLIATPFRYNPPHPNARFRPPFATRNVFYGALAEETALYEHAYHFIRQRLHLNVEPETGTRTLFIAEANAAKSIHIRDQLNYQKIMDKNDYSASHQFIEENSHATFILYPSCRDPKHRDNAAILEIEHLEKKLKGETSIRYFYNYKKQRLLWIDSQLYIDWEEVE
jgi:hypothetical protein